MSAKMLNTLSQKLGIGDSKVVNKAEELMRLIELKNVAVPLNGTSRLVVALDLAATCLKFTFDRNQAIGLAGISKKNYITSLQLLEDILNLSKNLSIRDICLQLGCMNVINDAAYILKKYEQIYAKHNGLDCEKPMFLAAAVFVSCKKSKTKIDQTKLVEISKIKNSMLKRIITAMEPLSQDGGTDDGQSHKRSKTLLETVEDKFNDTRTSKKKMRLNSQESQEQDYDSWRKKILENASAEIESMK